MAILTVILLAACTASSSSPSASDEPPPSGGPSAPESSPGSDSQPPPADASVQDKLDWLAESGLTGDDRRAFLVEQAASAGPVVLYGSLNESLMQDWQVRLTEEFPEFEVQVLRLQESDERIRAESDAGQPVASVYDMDPEGAALFLSEGGRLASYASPELEGIEIADGVEHPDGLYTIHSQQPMVAVYNTDLITPDELPATFEELADPSWDTPFARSQFGARWIAAIIEAEGEEEGMAIIEAIAAHEPTIFDSNSGMREAVILGQIPFAIDTQLSGVYRSIADGAPVDWHRIDPTFTDVGSVSILSDAPNPYGAVLIYDWILSVDGGQQNFIGDTLGVRPEVDYELPGFENLVTEAIGYTPQLLADVAQYEEIWQDLFIR